MGLGGLVVVGQQVIHEAEQLHHTLILSQVFVTLQQENVLHTIGSVNGELPWTLFGVEHAKSRCKRADADNRLSSAICTRNSQFEVSGAEKFG